MPRTPASVVIVTYNSQLHLEEALRALQDDPEGPTEVVVVDNGSTDLTAEVAAGYEVRWLPLDENRGFGAACNAGAELATGEVVVFLNPDAAAAPGWLPPLVEALDQPGVGAAMPTIELAGSPGHFNSSGGVLSYVGLSWAGDCGAPIPEEIGIKEVHFPSGAGLAMRKSLFREMEGFRSDFFLYAEDADLGWRLRLRGLRSVRVPDSRVAHHYDFGANPGKYHYLERNRLLMLAANYRWDTLAILLPALLAAELRILAVSIRDGWMSEKVSSWGAAWRQRPLARAAHARVQAYRSVGDADLVRWMDGLPSQITQVPVPRGARLADALLRGYWHLALGLLGGLEKRRRSPLSAEEMAPEGPLH
ncbi:MAG: glycosyltransferase family 2 protein [Acidimicrobiia bacterium]